MQLQEPLLLIGAFLLLFSLVIAYNRCNFRITKDAKWAEENRAERAAFLLKEIESIVSGTSVLPSFKVSSIMCIKSTTLSNLYSWPNQILVAIGLQQVPEPF